MMLAPWNRLRRAGFAGLGMLIAALAAAPAGAETSLVIRDFVLARDIQQREPVGATESFRAGEVRAFAFARIWNSGKPVRISFLWRHGDKVVAARPATVGVSPAWRTWSTVDLRPGAWRVALVDVDGTVLAEREFSVGPASDAPVATSEAPAQGGAGMPTGRTDGPFSSEIPASAE